MGRKPKAYVLDSWSVIAYLEDEPAGQQVADLIADAHEAQIPVLMSVVNAGEVWYLIARASSEPDADQAVAELRQLGIEIVDVDWDLTRAAAELKAKHRISYADSFAAALARRSRARLVTGQTALHAVHDQLRTVGL